MSNDPRAQYQYLPPNALLVNQAPNPAPLRDPVIHRPNLPDVRTLERGWARLVRGQGVGKSSVLIYDAENPAQQGSPVSILEIGGAHTDVDAGDACPIILTIAPPRVIPMALATVRELYGNAQNLTGEQNNIEIAGLDPFPGTTDPIVWPQMEAIIEWGTGGMQAQARCDFSNGLTVSLSASWLRVHAAAVPTDASGITGTSAAYWLAAFASLGWGRPGIAQKTVYVGDVDQADSSEVFAIPRFAKRAYLIGCSDTDPPPVTVGTIRFWRSPDGTNNAGNLFVSGNQPQAFDVPNGAMYFSVYSGMSVTAPFSVVFELAI